MAYNGVLNNNEFTSGLKNMIFKIVTLSRLADKHELVDEALEEGSQYGDTALDTAVDVIYPDDWDYSTNSNLLGTYKNDRVTQQAFTLNVFKQVALTTNPILQKRSWMTEGAYSQYISIVEGMIAKAYRLYNATTFNSFFGCAKGYDVNGNEQKVEVHIPALCKPERKVKLIAQALADLKVKLINPSRAFNKYGYMTQYSPEDIKVVFNSKYVNEFTKLDLPAIFHNEDLISFDRTLPDWYFGTVNAADVAAVDNDGSYLAYGLQKFTIDGVSKSFFGGEAIPAGVKIPAGCGVSVDSTAVAKIYTRTPPYMSGFYSATSFVNAATLNKNDFATWGHNTLAIYDADPFVTLYVTVDEDAVDADPVIVTNDADNPVRTQEVSE